MSSTQYRDGCSGRGYGRFLVALVHTAVWFLNLTERKNR